MECSPGGQREQADGQEVGGDPGDDQQVEDLVIAEGGRQGVGAAQGPAMSRKIIAWSSRRMRRRAGVLQVTRWYRALTPNRAETEAA